MFHKGFEKVAVALVTLTPEEYFDVARQKDPYIGAIAGAVTGGSVGAIKGKKGSKATNALIGAGLGAAAGAGASQAVSKIYRKYQAHKVRQYTEGLHLRATPGRGEAGRGGSAEHKS